MAHGGIAILAVVFALSYAVFNIAVAIAREIVSVLQQHAYDEESGRSLTITVADTTIAFAEVLLYAITTGLVLLALFVTWLVTRGMSSTCPECRSHVPPAATVCRYCTSELPPASDA